MKALVQALFWTTCIVVFFFLLHNVLTKIFPEPQQPAQTIVVTDTVYVVRDCVLTKQTIVKQETQLQPVYLSMPIDSLAALLSKKTAYRNEYNDSLISIVVNSFVSGNQLDSAKISYKASIPQKTITRDLRALFVGPGISFDNKLNLSIAAGYASKKQTFGVMYEPANKKIAVFVAKSIPAY